VEFVVRRGEWKRAASMLEVLITERPEDEKLYGEFIRILAHIGKTHEIGKRLKKWLGDEELGLALTFSADELAQWFIDQEEAKEQNPRRVGLFRKLFHKGRQLRMISNVFALYDEAAKRIPDNELPVIRQAAFCLSRGMAKEAVAELEPFVERTNNYEAAVLLLQAKRQLAEETDAPEFQLHAMELAAELHRRVPADASVLLAWGDMLSELEKTDAALGKYEQVIRLEPFNPEVYVRVLNTLAEHRPEKMEEIAARIPEEVQIPEWIQLARAMALLTLEQAAPAYEILVALRQQEKEFTPALYELSRSELMLGNKAAALETIRELFSKEGGVSYLSAMADEPVFEEIHDEIDELVAGSV
jgi:tetratricopeptide (TPR) repeat protein